MMLSHQRLRNGDDDDKKEGPSWGRANSLISVNRFAPCRGGGKASLASSVPISYLPSATLGTCTRTHIDHNVAPIGIEPIILDTTSDTRCLGKEQA